MTRLTWLLGALFATAAALAADTPVHGEGHGRNVSPRPRTAIVAGVVHGDTLLLATRRRVFRARLGSVAAPAGRTCFAEQAKRALFLRLIGQTVEFRRQHRRPGEPVTYAVTIRGRDLAGELVSRGLGFARYRLEGGAHAIALRLAEERARTEGRGMWSTCFRPGDVRITSVDRRSGRIRLAGTLVTRELQGWRLERPARPGAYRLRRSGVGRGEFATVFTRTRRPRAAPPVGPWYTARWARRFREPLILSRPDGGWAAVWAGDRVRPPAGPVHGVYYAGARDHAMLPSLGVNTVVLPFHREIRRDLDSAARAGLKVIVIGGDWIAGEAAVARVRPVMVSRQIARIRDHPALWGYYAVDEPARRSIPLGVLQELYSTIKLNDAHRPVLVVFDQVASFGRAQNPYDRDVADVVAFDIYTVNALGYQPWIRAFLPRAAEVVRARTPGTPIWLVSQGFGGGRLAPPTGPQLVRQVREGVNHGGIEGTLVFLWDKHWQDRFPEFTDDVRSRPDLQQALVKALRVLVRGAG